VIDVSGSVLSPFRVPVSQSLEHFAAFERCRGSSADGCEWWWEVALAMDDLAMLAPRLAE